MESIEQLRRDTRPLIRLGSASVATNEPLGSLLSRLADKNTPLFVQRPPEGRVYCVTQSGSGSYQESILAPSKASWSNFGSNLARDPSIVEASHFRYLVLDASEYFDILAGDVTLSIKLFSQAAAFSNDELNINIVSSTRYFRENKTGSQLHQSIKAKFACYMQDGPEREGWPGMFNLMTVRVNSEELLVSRAALLDLIDKEKKSDELPPELTEHLQPWKSEFLRALNIAAYQLYSHFEDKEDSSPSVEKTEIEEAISKNLPSTKGSATRISLATTLLRPENKKQRTIDFLKKRDIRKYPDYFSLDLIYLNEKSKDYHDLYLIEGKDEDSITTTSYDLISDGIIQPDTARRIARDVKPAYKTITHHEE